MKHSQSHAQDDELISFLKTYSSPPPLENKPCEELIMRCVETEAISRKGWLNKAWLLSGSCITVLLIIGGYFWNMNTRSNPQVATDEVEKLETFMIETWYGAVTPEAELNFVNANE